MKKCTYCKILFVSNNVTICHHHIGEQRLISLYLGELSIGAKQGKQNLPVCRAHNSKRLQSCPLSQFCPAACFHAILKVFSRLSIQDIWTQSPSSNIFCSQGLILCRSRGRMGLRSTVLKCRSFRGLPGRPMISVKRHKKHNALS